MIVNLDPNFKPFGPGVGFKNWVFSGGEVAIKFEESAKYSIDRLPQKVTITCRLINSDRVMQLLMATDALRRMGWKEIDLFCPYIPYARQDRLMVPGESLSLKVFADLINTQNYSRILTYDVHSEVSTALLNNVENISNYKFVAKILKDKKDFWLVSIDAGSAKKIYGLTKYLSQNIISKDSYYGVVLCNKQRNVETGEITRIDVSRNDLNGFDCYIPDDIGDGLRSFIELAKELKKRNCGDIYIIVSHGIFSNGYELEGIKHVFTTNSFRDTNSPNITQIKVEQCL